MKTRIITNSSSAGMDIPLEDTACQSSSNSLEEGEWESEEEEVPETIIQFHADTQSPWITDAESDYKSVENVESESQPSQVVQQVLNEGVEFHWLWEHRVGRRSCYIITDSMLRAWPAHDKKCQITQVYTSVKDVMKQI